MSDVQIRDEAGYSYDVAEGTSTYARPLCKHRRPARIVVAYSRSITAPA